MGRNGIACQYESEKVERRDKAATTRKSNTVFDTKKLLNELDGARLLHLPVFVRPHRRLKRVDCPLTDLSSTVTASAPPIPNDVTVTASAPPMASDNVSNLRGIFDDLSDDVTPSNSDEEAESSDPTT